MMLDMLRIHCDYFLGNGNRSKNIMEDTKEHIEEMKRLWNSFTDDEKPEWISWEQILNYKKEMRCI